MNDLDLNHACTVACGWARTAGAMALERFGGALAARRKPDASPVTEVDLALQDFLIARIAETWPGHGVVGEEAGGRKPGGRWTWVIDPLDGTRNYAQGVPLFCVALALLDDGEPVVGIIHDPVADTTYHAVTGAGAWADGRPLTVVDAWSRDALIGMAIGCNQRWPAGVLEGLTARGILRNTGSTSQHLALVASGGLTAACARNAKLWDVAPGIVLVREAGGRLTGLTGAELFPCRVEAYDGASLPFVAAGPGPHADIVGLMALHA